MIVAPDDLTPRPLLRAPGAQALVFFPRILTIANRLPADQHLPIDEELFFPTPIDGPQFFWPLDVKTRSTGVPHGIDITAAPGALVRASRQGQVAVAAKALAGRGATLVLTHDEGYTSVYAGVATLLVAPGANVAQGSPIARLGAQPLHFEIRHEAIPVPMLSLLPGARES